MPAQFLRRKPTFRSLAIAGVKRSYLGISVDLGTCSGQAQGQSRRWYLARCELCRPACAPSFLESPLGSQHKVKHFCTASPCKGICSGKGITFQFDLIQWEWHQIDQLVKCHLMGRSSLSKSIGTTRKISLAFSDRTESFTHFLCFLERAAIPWKWRAFPHSSVDLDKVINHQVHGIQFLEIYIYIYEINHLVPDFCVILTDFSDSLCLILRSIKWPQSLHWSPSGWLSL